MKGEGLVSIIVPCYNYGRFLGEALESVRRQTYREWECIIIDDGSTDDTKAVANCFVEADDRFKYFYQPNKGTSPAKNNGIRRSRGQYLLFLDADDLIAEKKIEIHVNFLQQEPNVGLVYSDVRYFDTNNPNKLSTFFDLTDHKWIPGVSGKDEDILKPLLRYNIMVISAPLVRSDVVKMVGFFNEDLRGCEDWEYWIRCALKGCYFEFDGQEDVFTFVRIHSTSASKNRVTMLEGEIKMRKTIQSNTALSENLEMFNADLLFSLQKEKAIKLIELGKLFEGYKEIFHIIIETKRFRHYIRNIFLKIKRYSNFKSIFSQLIAL